MAEYKVIYKSTRTEEKTVTVPDDMSAEDVWKEFETEYYETEVISVQKVG